MSSSIKDLMAAMSEGVVMLSPAGKVRYANPAALRMCWMEPGADVPWTTVRQQLDALSKGYVRVPMRLKLEGGSVACVAIEATLMAGFTGQDFMLLMQDDSDAAAYRNVTSNLYQFVRAELVEPMEAVTGAVNKVLETLPRPDDRALATEALLEARRAGTELTLRLDKLTGFAELSTRHQMVANDRIEIPQLVERAWSLVSPLAEAADIRHSAVGLSDDLPPIYGSAHWITRALAELMENAIRHSDRKSHIELEVNQSSHFMLIKLRNHGQGVVPKRTGRVSLAFIDAVGADRKKQDGPKPGLGLGLAFAQRIMELHGGNIRIGAEADESTSFAMEMPTGAPAEIDDTHELQQAQRYARDMAALLARQRTARTGT